MYKRQRQDFPFVGLTSQVSVTYNRNREKNDIQIDHNGFPVRPALLGDLRGREYDVTYLGYSADGRIGRINLTASFYAVSYTHLDVYKRQHNLPRGEVDRVSPTIGDWHQVSNALTDQPSVSIHVYGADIGRVHRSFWDASTCELKPMVSGYSNDTPWITAR